MMYSRFGRKNFESMHFARLGWDGKWMIDRHRQATRHERTSCFSFRSWVMPGFAFSVRGRVREFGGRFQQLLMAWIFHRADGRMGGWADDWAGKAFYYGRGRMTGFMNEWLDGWDGWTG
ncbi:hypothetical protein ACMFMG_007480 [Clarireedia jacksonii]